MKTMFQTAMLCVLVILPLWSTAAADDGPAATAELLEVSAPFVFDGHLRNVPTLGPVAPGGPIKEVPRLRRPPAITAPEPRDTRDPLRHTDGRAPSTRSLDPPILSFAAQPFSNLYPPDTMGDVGVNYYIHAINDWSGTRIVIYNKADGSIAAGPIALGSLAPLGSNCANYAYGDPVVLYDELAGRWVLTEFHLKNNRTHGLCVYVSQGPDPIAGGWYQYEFNPPSFPDYPKYAVWPDAYYVGANESSPSAIAFDRQQMLAGQPASSIRFTATTLAGFGFQMLIPADLDGVEPPPSGEPALFLRHRDDEGHNPGSNNPAEDYIELWEMAVDWTTPGNSSFTKVADIATAEFDSSLCGWTSYSCFPQLGSSSALDPLREVVMHRAQYRHEHNAATVVGNFVTDVDGSDTGGIRWFQLSKPDGGAWSLVQEGTHSPDNLNRWLGSIAMDQSGNLALGYNVVDASMYASLFYSGRRASAAKGQLSEPELLIVGGDAPNNADRWGDYASLSLDPADGCTFWFTGEYGTGTSWGTWISSFRFAECGDLIFDDGFEWGDASRW